MIGDFAPTQGKPSVGVAIASPLARQHVAADDISSPYTEDLAWIVQQYRERVGASGVAVTIHHFDGRAPEIEISDGCGGPSPRELRSLAWTNRKEWGPSLGDECLKTAWRSPTDAFPWHSLTMHMASDESCRAVITAFYPEDRTTDPDAADYMACRFQPVLTGYFKLWLLQRSTSRRMQTMAAALAQLDFGVIALDRDARILFENPAASKILDEGVALQRCRGSVSAAGAVESVKLRLAIDQILSARNGGRTGAPIPLGSAGPGEPPMVAVVMSADQSGLAGDPVAILHIFCPAAGSGEATGSVCAWFSLSAAETRVVKHLVAGGSVAEVALQENLKEDTVRTYLKSVFRKTATKSQTDLVRLMLANPVRLSKHTL